MWATRNNQIDCLKLLVDSGGDINVRDNVSDFFVIMLSSVTLLSVDYIIEFQNLWSCVKFN